MPVSTIVAFAVAAAVAAVWVSRPLLVAVGGAITAAVSLVVTVVARPEGAGIAYWLLAEMIVTLPVIARVVRRLSPAWASASAVVLVAAVGVTPVRVARGLDPPAPAGETVAVCAGFAVLAGLAVVAGAYLRALDDARARVVAAARREQRLRLARDLHDWFGHEVTGIVLEAQAAQLDADPATAETLGRIEAAGQRALGSLDRALALTRQTSPLEDLSDVVDRFADGGRMTVRLDAAPAGDVDAEIADLARRVVTEALTNVRRHGDGVGLVLVRLRRDAGTLVVSVSDDGVRHPPTTRPGGGTGLAALAAHVDALGGTLTAGPIGPAGWTVHADLPVRP